MLSRTWKIGIHVLLVGIQVYFVLLCFTLLHFPGTDIFFFLVLSFFFFLIKLKVCGNPSSRKSISATFPTALVFN